MATGPLGSKVLSTSVVNTTSSSAECANL
jgi:hypothetical protein